MKGLYLTSHKKVQKHMATTKNLKPDIVQSFDVYRDREYYKIVSDFFFSSERLVRTDRIGYRNEWTISCENLPDKVLVNGREFRLVEVNKDDGKSN